MDNLIINIKDVHIRLEEEEISDKNKKSLGLTTAGILMSSLEFKTIDKNGNPVFHDRTVTKGKITKILKMEGLAIYMNPQDTLIIHQIASEARDHASQINSMQALMDKVVGPYRHLNDMVKLQKERNGEEQLIIEEDEEPGIRHNEFLTYILKPSKSILCH